MTLRVDHRMTPCAFYRWRQILLSILFLYLPTRMDQALIYKNYTEPFDITAVSPICFIGLAGIRSFSGSVPQPQFRFYCSGIPHVEQGLSNCAMFTFV